MNTSMNTYKHGVFKSTHGYPLRMRWNYLRMFFKEAWYRGRPWPTDDDIEAVGDRVYAAMQKAYDSLSPEDKAEFTDFKITKTRRKP